MRANICTAFSMLNRLFFERTHAALWRLAQGSRSAGCRSNLAFSLCFLIFSSLVALPSTAKEAVDPYPENWEGPKLYEMIFSTRGETAEERAKTVANWMNSNDWRSVDFELRDLYNLYEMLAVDALEYSSFSVRWQGFITAPQAGEYTFRQVQDFSSRNSDIRITIGGKTILDSGLATADTERFLSKAVSLSAGKATPIEVEFVHNVPYPIGRFAGGAPMALLTWSKDGGAEKLIPASSFSPPSESSGEAEQGLLGEYFRSTNFKDLCASRIDPTIDFVWTAPPVTCSHDRLAGECLNRCKKFVLNAEFLQDSMREGDDSVFDYNLWRVVYRMSATERERLVDILFSRPDLLSKMSCRSIARLSQALYMLPDDKHVSLIGEWSTLTPQPRSLAGSYPGWSEGSYQEQNTDFYWLMGLFKQGPYWKHAEQLMDEYLVLPNGECNLKIAYLTAYATREESHNRDSRHMTTFYDLIQRHLDDDRVVGDVRVTWLLARNFVDEIIAGEHPQLRPHSDYLNEARLVAESADYQGWVLQEVAVRMAANGDVDSLNELLKGEAGDLPEQQDKFASWRSIASSQVEIEATRREQEARESAAALAKELERRLALSQRNNNPATTERYQVLLEKTQSDKE